MNAFDPRITPARPDLAAKHLEGRVDRGAFRRRRGLRGHRCRRRRCAERRRPMLRSIPRRSRANASPSTRRPMRAGAGDSSRATAMSAGCRRMRWRAPGPPPTHKVAVPRTLVFPGASIKLPPVDFLSLGCRLAILRLEGTFAVTCRRISARAPSRRPLDARETGLRRRRRTVPRRALSVGRQDQPRHRLLGARSGRADRGRALMPARQRHAGAGVGNGDRSWSRPLQSAPRRSDVLGGSRRHRPRFAERWCTPTPFTWRSRSSRWRRRLRELQRPATRSRPSNGWL